MRSVRFIDSQTMAVLGVFKSIFVYNTGDHVAISDKVYIVISTLKYVYLDAEEVEYVSVSLAGDNK